jgi:hypothetical protein
MPMNTSVAGASARARRVAVTTCMCMAFAARTLLKHEAGSDPARLRRLACRFAGMVILGTSIVVRLDGTASCAEGRALFFTVLNANGAPAIREGVAVIAAGG